MDIDLKRIYLYQLAEVSEIISLEKANKLLNEHTDEFIEKIWIKIYLQEFISALIFLGFYLINKAREKKKKFLKLQDKKCEHLIGIEKENCLKDIKRRANEIEISELKKNLPQCNKGKNSEKCRRMINKRIATIQSKIKL